MGTARVNGNLGRRSKPGTISVEVGGVDETLAAGRLPRGLYDADRCRFVSRVHYA